MRTLPQQSHADLGLVDDDNTEVLKSRTVLVNPGVTSTGEDRSGITNTHKKAGNSIMTQSTAPTSCPALPPGADHASDDWETYDGVTQRLVWSTRWHSRIT